jgi:transposase
MIDQQGIQPSQRLAPDKFLEFLKKQKALARRVVMVYEAGPYGYDLYRRATALGVECLVCAPERLNRGRKRTNDKLDARELASRLDRYLAGNTAALRVVRPPTIEQEMARRQARERNTYRKDRQRCMARGRSALHTLGISRPGFWWEPERFGELMEQVRRDYGEAVRDRIRDELEGYLEALHVATLRFDKLTAALRTAGAAKKEPRIKGIGPLSTELLDREVRWHDFQNRRQIGSYTGLCPGEDSTGDSELRLSIDKHGNPRVRALLVELAWLLPRFQPDYIRLARWKWVFEPGSKASSAVRKKAAAALGRHLGVDLWRIKTGRARPEDLGLTLLI